VLLVHRETHLAQVALLVFELEAEPGAAVLHQLQSAPPIGLFLALHDALPREQVGHHPFEDRPCFVPAQGGVAAPASTIGPQRI